MIHIGTVNAGKGFVSIDVVIRKDLDLTVPKPSPRLALWLQDLSWSQGAFSRKEESSTERRVRQLSDATVKAEGKAVRKGGQNTNRPDLAGIAVAIPQKATGFDIKFAHRINSLLLKNINHSRREVNGPVPVSADPSQGFRSALDRDQQKWPVKSVNRERRAKNEQGR